MRWAHAERVQSHREWVDGVPQRFWAEVCRSTHWARVRLPYQYVRRDGGRLAVRAVADTASAPIDCNRDAGNPSVGMLRLANIRQHDTPPARGATAARLNPSSEDRYADSVFVLASLLLCC